MLEARSWEIAAKHTILTSSEAILYISDSASAAPPEHTRAPALRAPQKAHSARRTRKQPFRREAGRLEHETSSKQRKMKAWLGLEEKEQSYALEQVEAIRLENEEEFKSQIQEVYELMRSSMQDVLGYKR